MKLFAVIGNPILHSKSPAMHNAAISAAGTEGRYLRLAASSSKQALTVSREIGISGVNVTAPFKEEMAQLVDDLTPEAKETAAVNTVVIEPQRTRGFNTDLYGITQSLRDRGVPCEGKTAVVLGAGGSARAAVAALRGIGAKVVIANRTISKAKELATKFDAKAVPLNGDELQRYLTGEYIIINCTSETGPLISAQYLTSAVTVLDSQYRTESVLTRDAIKAGARVVSGLDWLLNQGARAFEIFAGVTPNVKAMREGLDKSAVPDNRRIAFIGMMSSGKTTISKLFAERCGWTNIELDGQIMKRAGRTIPQIFKESGEPAFREIEKECLREAAQKEHVVISSGGGVVSATENRELLRSNCTTVWLWANPKELGRRIQDPTSRPLLKDSDPTTKLHEISEQRIPLYVSCCDLVVPTEGVAPEDIVERIMYETGLSRKG